MTAPDIRARSRQGVDPANRLDELRTAVTALEAGHHTEAERASRRLLGHQPADVEAQLLLGLAIGARGDALRAAPWLNRVAFVRPLNAHPARDLALLFLRQGKSELGGPQYQACLDLAPHDMRLRYAFAEFRRDNGAAEEAIDLLAPVLRAHPDAADAHYEMGLALAEAGQFAEATTRFRQAIAIDPAPATFWANLGMMLKVEGRFDDALDAYSAALERSPNDVQIRVNRAVVRLHAGRLAEAWQDEEWRLTQPGSSQLPPEKLLPPLSRLPDLSGRTVLVVQEEGFGDTFQFMRYLPMLAARGARVALAVPVELARVMRAVTGVVAVPGCDAPVPEHDFHCSFNGLPRAFETTLATIPSDVPYLAAESALAAYWARRLPPTEGTLRVGLVWAGQARPWLAGFSNLDRRRSTNLATLAPLAAIPGVRFVNLQKGPATRDKDTADNAFDLFDPMPEVRDFADTAAIIANLDVVVSVDTSVVHLAGAMGKPVFLLDRYDNCWRWLRGREDSPWYPTLRIFRQQRSGEWAPVIARVADALTLALAGG